MSSEHFNVDGTPVDAGELVRLGRRFPLVGERAVRCVQRFDFPRDVELVVLVANDTEAESLTYHLRSAGYAAVASVEHETQQRLVRQLRHRGRDRRSSHAARLRKRRRGALPPPKSC